MVKKVMWIKWNTLLASSTDPVEVANEYIQLIQSKSHWIDLDVAFHMHRIELFDSAHVKSNALFRIEFTCKKKLSVLNSFRIGLMKCAHALPTERSKRVVVLCLHDTVARFRTVRKGTGVNSRRSESRPGFTLTPPYFTQLYFTHRKWLIIILTSNKLKYNTYHPV